MSIYKEDYFNPELWLEYKSHSIAETLDHVVFNGVHLAEQNFLRGTLPHPTAGRAQFLSLRDDGKFILMWWYWIHHPIKLQIADYVVLDELPKPGDVFDGVTINLPSGEVSEHLIHKAKKALKEKVGREGA